MAALHIVSDRAHPLSGRRVHGHLQLARVFRQSIIVLSLVVYPVATAKAGNIIQIRFTTFWAQYHWSVVIVILAAIVEAALLIYLLTIHKRQQKTEGEVERYTQLAQSEHRHLLEVVSNVPGIVWETRIDPKTNKRQATFVSNQVQRILGYTPEEWLATPDHGLKIMPDEGDREKVTRDIEEVVKNGRTGSCQFRWKAKDGRILWMEANLSPLVDDSGKTVGLRGVTFDITERKLAEEALRQTEQNNRAILRAIPDMMFLNTREGLFLNYHAKNPTDLFVPPEMFIGKHIRDVFPRKLTDQFLQCFERATVSDETQVLEYMLTVEGQEHWFEARIVSSGDNILSVVRDVTDRKASLDELRRSEEQLHSTLQELSRAKTQLEAENIYLRQELEIDQEFSEIVGQSDAIKYVRAKISQVAPTDSTVLITGETGTGKELVARAIHGASTRKEQRLIKVNCAVLSKNLIESELFGHEKGAFTGADARKIGRFELADHGTMFLDEVGELPLELQSKLLRVLQEGEFERVGGSKTIKVNVRIIAATNRNLKGEVEKGAFREDLWYRLNVFPITVPPLRQRKEDIPLLVEHFARKCGKELGKTITSVSPRTMQNLQTHAWPGNIRELANVIERAAIHANTTVLQLVDEFDHAQEEPRTSMKSLEDMEREHIIRILDNSGWRIEGPYGAAKILGLNPSTLRARLAKLGIQRPRPTSV
jgi:chemotaxis protein methyltransferase CheR